MGAVEAAIEAARVRLRPILMTAFSFILGVVPLVVATGAGAASRHSLGTAVFGGMLASTILSLGVVPVLFVVIVGLSKRGLHVSDLKLAYGKLKEWLVKLWHLIIRLWGWIKGRKKKPKQVAEAPETSNV
jgi:hypothetical protein